MKILLIEDQETNQLLFKTMVVLFIDFITRQSVEKIITTAISAKDAIKFLEEETFDYILLDGQLFQSSGIEVLNYLVNNKKKELAKVVFSSAKPGLNEQMANQFGVKTVEKRPDEIKKYIKRIGNETSLNE